MDFSTRAFFFNGEEGNFFEKYWMKFLTGAFFLQIYIYIYISSAFFLFPTISKTQLIGIIG